MLVFLEIALTVAAWKKGWRGWALLPLGLLVSVGLLLGFTIGLNGGTEKDFLPLGMLLDIGAIVALALMARCGPATEDAPPPEDARHPAPVWRPPEPAAAPGWLAVGGAGPSFPLYMLVYYDRHGATIIGLRSR